MNIPLAHLQGGEVTGNIDEKVRHAITKLADIHLVSSEDALRRVRSLGEANNKIFNVAARQLISQRKCSMTIQELSITKKNMVGWEPTSVQWVTT